MASDCSSSTSPDSEQQKIQLTARYVEQNGDNAHSLPPLRSLTSFQTEADTNLISGCPSSCSHNDVEKGETYPTPGLLISPESPTLTDNNSPTSVTTKKEVSSSNSKNHFVLSSILDLKRFNPAIKLKNCGCVARDHLASERTFIAYAHTSLCLSCAGASIVQLVTIADFTISKYSEIPMLEVKMKRFAIPLGVMSQVLALCILFLGEWFTTVPPPSFFFGARHFVSGECQ